MISTMAATTPDQKADYNVGYIWLISVAAALGGLLFGWDWVVIGGASHSSSGFFTSRTTRRSPAGRTVAR